MILLSTMRETYWLIFCAALSNKAISSELWERARMTRLKLETLRDCIDRGVWAIVERDIVYILFAVWWNRKKKISRVIDQAIMPMMMQAREPELKSRVSKSLQTVAWMLNFESARSIARHTEKPQSSIKIQLFFPLIFFCLLFHWKSLIFRVSFSFFSSSTRFARSLATLTRIWRLSVWFSRRTLKKSKSKDREDWQRMSGKNVKVEMVSMKIQITLLPLHLREWISATNIPKTIYHKKTAEQRI